MFEINAVMQKSWMLHEMANVILSIQYFDGILFVDLVGIFFEHGFSRIIKSKATLKLPPA